MQNREVNLEDTRPLQAGLVAGFLGSLLLFGIQKAMEASTGLPPTGEGFAQTWLNVQGPPAIALGLLLFGMAGAAWGAVYIFMAKEINVLGGAIFGLLPWTAVMLAYMPMTRGTIFAGGDPLGILAPLVLNVIWGAFIGALIPALPFRRQEWLNDHS